MHAHSTRRTVLRILLAAFVLSVAAGCQSVKIVNDKRIPGFNRQSLLNRGVVLLVKVDRQTEAKYPGMTRAMMDTFAHQMKAASIIPGHLAMAVADKGQVENDARAIVDHFRQQQALDHDAFATVAPIWREAYGNRYLVVIAVDDPFTYHDRDTHVSDRYDKNGKLIETTTTESWGSGTKTIVRLFAVPLDRPTVAWRIYAEGDFAKGNEQSRTYDRRDSFGQAMLRTLFDSLGDDPAEFPKPPSGQNSAAKTLARMLGALHR